MPVQKKEVKFDTKYKTTPGSTSVAIVLEKELATPNTVEGFVSFANNLLNSNNVEIDPADLCLTMKNNLKDVSFELNDAGELIVNAPDADNYSLDAQGNLIYTYR